MRIIYLINGLNGGGAAFPMMQVIGLMRELGHDVEVLALMLQDGKAGSRLKQAGIPFEVLGRSTSGNLRQTKALIHHLRARRPNLIWTSLTRGTLYGQVIGGLMRIPVVSWQHSDYLKPGNLAALHLTRRLTCMWVADSDSVSCSHSSVIVLQVNFDGIFALKSKSQALVARHIACVSAFLRALERVPPISRQVHIRRMLGNLQAVQHAFNTGRPGGRNFAVITLGEKQLQSLVSERANHGRDTGL